MFVVSSDFCHWGRRFNYMPFAGEGEIFKAIEALDRQGMGIVEAQDPAAFTRYLQQHSNTICGRHPIGTPPPTPELRRPYLPRRGARDV